MYNRYQVMTTHLSLVSRPRRVLDIGGGDGGVVQDVPKHDTVESVVLCDIDEVSVTSAHEGVDTEGLFTL